MDILGYLSPDIWLPGKEFTDQTGKTTIILHPTPLFPLTLEPWSHETFSMEAGAQSYSLLGAQTKILILAKEL